MTFQHEETAQPNQTASERQNNGRPEIKITVFPAVHTQKSVLDNLKQLRERIAQDVREFDQKDLPENLQTEIPKLAVLLQRIERLVLGTNQDKKLGALNSLVCSLEVALSSLFQKKLSKEFTRQIRLDIEKEVIRHEHPRVIGLLANQFFYIWHSKSVRLSVIYGLSWSFIIIFGGLFSLALLQYAVYNSNADTRKVEALISKQDKKIDDLNAKIDRERAKTKTTPSQLGAENQREALLDDELATKALVIADLQRKTDEAQMVKQKLETQQERIAQTKRSSLIQNILSSVDIGFSKILSQILWVAAAGTLGSIVSILTRVIGKSYDQEAYCDRLTPIFIGFFKPVVGASFGILFLAFINSGVVSTPLIPATTNASSSDAAIKAADNPETKAAFFLFSVAFVVGFSERLAKDTITKLEGGSQEEKETSQQPVNTRVIVIRSSKAANQSRRNQNAIASNQTADSSNQDESA
ncbi:MAG: hypothetical protein KME45_10360 [Stenomitos rutilans HA7619-LM2]|jgi:hypothetical protein|nr:hypothetical protein [Stenomitos rutilans HA7619-LM2]